MNHDAELIEHSKCNCHPLMGLAAPYAPDLVVAESAGLEGVTFPGQKPLPGIPSLVLI